MLLAIDRLTRLLRRCKRTSAIGRDHAHATLDRNTTNALAQVAHEMRQPLGAALAAFGVICSTENDSLRHRATTIVRNQFDRMSRLIEDLAAVTRLGFNAPSLQLQQLDIRTVISEVTDAVAPLAAEKGRRLVIDLPSDAIWVNGDRVRLQQVISNVLLNAIKHTESGGLIQLRLKRQEWQTVLTISDTGTGIDPTLLPYIFEPFVKGSDDREGVGIGLAVAPQLVELHKGSICAASAGPECGSEFEVTLPVLQESSYPVGQITGVDRIPSTARYDHSAENRRANRR